jgi:hypothetical protein
MSGCKDEPLEGPAELGAAALPGGAGPSRAAQSILTDEAGNEEGACEGTEVTAPVLVPLAAAAAAQDRTAGI